MRYNIAYKESQHYMALPRAVGIFVAFLETLTLKKPEANRLSR
jgi:hypothetical protein